MCKIKRRRVPTQSIKLEQDTHGTRSIQIKSVWFSSVILQQSLEDGRLSFQMQIQVVYDYTEKAVQYYDPVSGIILIIYKQVPHPNKESGGLTFTGFAVFIQLQTRRTPAVETSDGVTAESLAASVGLLTFIHIWRRETKFMLQSLRPEHRGTGTKNCCGKSVKPV